MDYRDLLERVKVLPTANTELGIEEVQKIISKGKKLSANDSQYNSALDAELWRATCTVVGPLTSNALTANTYDENAFAKHVALNPIFWHFPFDKEVPTISYLYGTFEPIPPEPKKRVVRQVINRQVAGTTRSLPKLAKIHNESKLKAATVIYQFLQEQYENGSCSYFHLVLDPESFSKTVENIYNVACLVRDNLVAIFIDTKTGLPHVKYLRKKKGEATNTNRKHFIESIDMQRWRDLVQALKIRSPLLSLNDNTIEDDEMSDDQDDEMSS